MKRAMILALFAMLGLNALGQSPDLNGFQLAVHGGINDRTLHFNPEKRIKLQTLTGEIIYSRQYSIYENHILTENNNLVYLEDLARIKGRVMNDSGRVAAGAVLLTTGVILLGSTLAIAVLVLTPGTALLLSVIEAGMIVKGAQIMGHRTFLMDKGWEVQTIQHRE